MFLVDKKCPQKGENMTNTELLKKKISDSGLKKSHIAKCVGISRGMLNKKINNESAFNQYQIEKICQVLNITSLKEKELIFFANDVD